jgi:hypothetical protein
MTVNCLLHQISLSVKKSAKSFLFPSSQAYFPALLSIYLVHKTTLNIIKVKTNLLHFGECVCRREKWKMKTIKMEQMVTVEKAQKAHV